MSDTPKTDTNCGWPVGHHGRIESSDLKLSPDGPFVHSSVARELERENAALRADLLIEEERSIYWRDNEGKAMAENAALREDKERLDWLERSQKLWEGENCLSGPEFISRAAIDAARKEAKP